MIRVFLLSLRMNVFRGGQSRKYKSIRNLKRDFGTWFWSTLRYRKIKQEADGKPHREEERKLEHLRHQREEPALRQRWIFVGELPHWACSSQATATTAVDGWKSSVLRRASRRIGANPWALDQRTGSIDRREVCSCQEPRLWPGYFLAAAWRAKRNGCDDDRNHQDCKW